MVPNSAYSIISITEGQDYEPEKKGKNYLKSPVYAFLCTKTNTAVTKLQPLGNEESLDFPPGSFRQGVAYYIYVKKFVSLGGGEFKGWKYTGSPLVL